MLLFEEHGLARWRWLSAPDHWPLQRPHSSRKKSDSRLETGYEKMAGMAHRDFVAGCRVRAPTWPEVLQRSWTPVNLPVSTAAKYRNRDCLNCRTPVRIRFL